MRTIRSSYLAFQPLFFQMLNPVRPNEVFFRIRLEMRWGKTNTQIRIWKFLDGEKSGDSTDLPEKNTERKPCMTPSRADVYLMAFEQGLNLIGEKRNWMSWGQHLPIPSSRRQALELFQCGDELGFAVVLLFDFLNHHHEKANPIPVAYPPCSCARKRQFWKCYIREYLENLTYSVEYGGVDSGEDSSI